MRAFFRQRLKVSFERESLERGRRALRARSVADLGLAGRADQGAARGRGAGRRTCHGARSGARGNRRRGEIASGAFGLCAAATLAEPMEGLFAEYLEACGDWPRQVDEVVELRLAFDTGDARLELADWLDGLRLAADGEARAA